MQSCLITCKDNAIADITTLLDVLWCVKPCRLIVLVVALYENICLSRGLIVIEHCAGSRYKSSVG